MTLEPWDHEDIKQEDIYQWWMSMSYVDYVIAIVGHKSVVKSSQNIQTPITMSVSIVNLKLASLILTY